MRPLPVLFWDIDGTLLTTARAGIFAWEDAVRDVAGRVMSLQGLETAGMTDVEIARRILENAGLESRSEAVSLLIRRYEDLLPSRLPLRQGRVLPGVRELLEHLRPRPDVHSMLLTGNTAAAARAKLSYYGLAPYFSRGAFADDGEDRVAIARRAAEMAHDPHARGGPPRLFVIGDTPHDIRCGEAIGALTIAVATGPYTVDELAACRPWWVVDRLPDPPAFLDRLLGRAGSGANSSTDAR